MDQDNTQNETSVETSAPKRIINVSRNDVTVPFVEKQILRGDAKGKGYFAPEVNGETLETILKFLGADVLISIGEAYINRQAQGWTSEATADDGTFDEKQFVDFATTMSARGESIKELLERRETILDDMSKLDADNDAHLPLLKKYMTSVKNINAAIGSKRRKSEEDKAAEAAATATGK